MMQLSLLKRFWVFCVVLCGVPVSVRGGDRVDFTTEVRPILSQHCFMCHGQDEHSRKGSLRLDIAEDAYGTGDSGEHAIVPGKPDASELVRRILSEDESDQMPPPASKHPLSDEKKRILKQWVAEGAEYKRHWAFVPPVVGELPKVKQSDWPRNPIDHYVLSKLEEQGLTPAGEADRSVLVRRVSLDLIGLPPTPAEVEAFLNDTAPGAYERLVDRLLSSPHYGERWARRWLDLARYADTNGYEKDRQRSIWAYRDWVIDALNKDLPFDQFTIEQLAGDMLPEATLSQKIATGFHRNTMLNEEGGIDPLEFRFYAMVDRMNTTATTWLGLTMGCAVCHTHKYDPIQQKEYYQMLAFLNNTDEPRLDIPVPEITHQRDQILKEIAAKEAHLIEQFPPDGASRWNSVLPLQVTSTEKGSQIEQQEDRSVLFLGENPDKADYTVTFETNGEEVPVIRLEALTDSKIPGTGPGRTGHGNFVLSEVSVTVAPVDHPDQAVPVGLVSATADHSQGGFEIEKSIDGRLETGWAIDETDKTHQKRSAVFTLATGIVIPSHALWTVTLKQQHGSQHTIGCFRLSLQNNAVVEAKETPQEHFQRKYEAWLKEEAHRVIEWTVLTPVKATSNLPLLTIEPEGIIRSRGDQTKRDLYEVHFQGDLAGVTALRLDVLPDDSLPEHGPGRIYYEGPFGDFHLSEVTAEQGGKPLVFGDATDSFNSTARNSLDGNPQTGWSINGGQGKEHHAVYNLEKPLTSGEEITVRLLFEKYYAAGLGKFRILATKDGSGVRARGYPAEIEAGLKVVRELISAGVGNVAGGEKLESRIPPELNDRLKRYFVSQAPELEEARQELEALKKRIPLYPTTLVMEERPRDNPRPTFIHKRGEYLQPTEEVKAMGLSILPPFPESASRDRLNFARWLVDGRNPLVARVVMNRHWGTIFGQALVKTTEDFGFQGDSPSHPELLDWLAVEFVRNGWSVKQMHKLIVLSATYRQSSEITDEKLSRDPTNKWLSRAPRFRIEAELVRDSALRISGLLSEKIGGPSVFPPQPLGVSTEGAYGGLDWKVSEGPDRYRRGLYTFTKRTAPYAMFAVFDAPSGESCIPRRDVTNTPLQALTVLNDSVFVESAQHLGGVVASESGTTEEKMQRLFRRVLTRSATADELSNLIKFYEEQIGRFKSGELDSEKIGGTGGGDPVERSAWALVSRVLFNLDETFTKE